MGKLMEQLKLGRTLVSDGALGTALYAKGLKPGDCPELWSVDRYGDVTAIAKSYIDAGSDIVETNSFGASSFKLEHYGLADRAAEINRAAAKAARQAAGDKLVAGSMGPTGKMLLMGDVTAEQLYDAFYAQAQALREGGTDAVCIETMMDADEAVQAVKAAKAVGGLDVMATFTFERTKQGEYRTMMGIRPADAARAVLDAGADVIGANCGDGMEHMADVVKELRDIYKEEYILVHANAGLPRNVDGGTVYPETPREMAMYAEKLLDLGTNIIGGCCGTTPEHIKALRQLVDTRG
jgi:5-methyltetrahydrofolate--homocysteine methyltransferase